MHRHPTLLWCLIHGEVVYWCGKPTLNWQLEGALLRLKGLLGCNSSFCISLQFALRLLAFRQIHKVLGMDPLPQINARFNIRNSRKRRRDNSDGTDSFEGEGKKDKKDYDSF